MPEAVGNSCCCGSGLACAECCQPLLSGVRQAATASALMRSRYAAFAVDDAAYLLATWHPQTRPPQLKPQDLGDVQWLSLQITDVASGGEQDQHGEVEFIARYRMNGRVESHHERSRFSRVQGQWLYVDGGLLPTTAAVKTGRNARCECGSGRKYKQCCGRRSGAYDTL
ncbi:MAG: SEC-C domain-containing protein [Gammaproteobacteria bacterium]|nr:SEC-C domain-containing protein [Gammaproteobacteria bacterium]